MATVEWRMGASEHALATLQGVEPKVAASPLLGLYLQCLGNVLWTLRQFAQSESVLLLCLARARSARDSSLEVSALTVLSILESRRGNSVRSEDYLDQAESLCETVGDQERRVHLLVNRGIALVHRERFEEASSKFEDAIFWSLRLGLRQVEARASANLGAVNFFRRQFEVALRNYERAESIQAALGLGELVSTRAGIAEILVLENSPDAEPYLERLVIDADSVQAFDVSSWARIERGRLLSRRGLLSEARNLWLSASEIATARGLAESAAAAQRLLAGIEPTP